MKHFIIEVTYVVPLTKIDEMLADHRKFLQDGYNKVLLLFSGPRKPRSGGIIAARADSLEYIKSFFENDPYKINNLATYEFFEFDPVKFQPFLEDWIKLNNRNI
jgi:uncharacterized protein YciI